MTDLFSRYLRGVANQRLLITVIKKNVLYDSEDHRHQQITPDKQRERGDADEPSKVDLFSVTSPVCNQSAAKELLLEPFISALYVPT